MTDAVSHAHDHHHHLTLFEKLSVWAGWFAAGAIFHTLGWMAMAPHDPLGAVSLLARSNPTAMLLQAGGLAVVAAVVAVVLSGRKIANAGPFAAALGLVVVSLRAETAEYLLLLSAQSAPTALRTLAVSLAFESLAWFLVILATFGASGLVMRWCFGSSPDPNVEGAPSSVRSGLLHMSATAAIALLAYTVLSTGAEKRAIQHGQVCFVTAASFWIGCYFAHRFVHVRGIFWTLLSVPLAAFVAYMVAGFRGVDPGLPSGIPSASILRALPIQFVALGSAGLIMAYGSMLRHRDVGHEDDHAGPSASVGQDPR